MKNIVVSDVYNISARVRSIDSTYRILYDSTKGDYLMYSNNEYQINLGKVLDARVISHIYDTINIDAKELFASIDKHNAEIQIRLDETNKYENSYKFKQIFDYANAHSNNLYDITQSVWV